MDLISPNSIGVLTKGQISLTSSLREHWPEYLMEALELALFMVSACFFTVWLYHPASTIAASISSEHWRRMLMGLAMGSTAVAIIFSPIGKRSGAHFNPAVTLTYLRLNKIEPWDAAFYTLFQFGGGIAGVTVASLVLPALINHPKVNYAATIPGPQGLLLALAAEILISFVMMSVILTVSNTKRLGRWTGLFAGALVATYITLESPISGMSMNPARSFSSASVGNIWTALWIYFIAPPLGMLLAAETYLRVRTTADIRCAKLHHHNRKRCIFRCNFTG
jgi:aquaporin Z